MLNNLKRIARRTRERYFPLRSDPVKNLQSTEFEVDNWIISRFIINKLEPVADTHPYPICELNLMASAVCRLRPQQIFEWGTNIGKSARIFYETARYFKIPLTIDSIDLPDDHEHQEHPGSTRGFMVKHCKNVTLHQADGLSRAIELYNKHPDNRTLVFIDGDHSYESVHRELNGVIKEMPNANILLHDTFYQSEDAAYNIGPHKAVTETIESMPGVFRVLSTNMGLPGMTLLYRI